jgi:hypothetical protein
MFGEAVRTVTPEPSIRNETRGRIESPSQSTRSTTARAAAHSATSSGWSGRGPSAITKSFLGWTCAIDVRRSSVSFGRLKMIIATGTSNISKATPENQRVHRLRNEIVTMMTKLATMGESAASSNDFIPRSSTKTNVPVIRAQDLLVQTFNVHI